MDLDERRGSFRFVGASHFWTIFPRTSDLVHLLAYKRNSCPCRHETLALPLMFSVQEEMGLWIVDAHKFVGRR
jgi:hypothetical protein